MKIRLDLNDLAVESFVTHAGTLHRGTVLGNSPTGPSVTDFPAACQTGGGYSCDGTCGDSQEGLCGGTATATGGALCACGGSAGCTVNPAEVYCYDSLHFCGQTNALPCTTESGNTDCMGTTG